MTKLLHEQTQNALPDYLKRHGKAKLSLKAGVGVSVIEDILAGRLCEDHLLRQVCKILNIDAMDGVYLTNDLKIGQNAANYATTHKLCIGLTADTGMGKSMVAELLTKRDNTFLYTIEESTTPRVFLKGLLATMRVWFAGSAHAMLHKVADKLCSVDSPLLVEKRNEKLFYRFYYYSRVLKYNYDNTVNSLSEEFDLAVFTICYIISNNTKRITEVGKEKLTAAQLKKKYPSFSWNHKEAVIAAQPKEVYNGYK